MISVAFLLAGIVFWVFKRLILERSECTRAQNVGKKRVQCFKRNTFSITQLFNSTVKSKNKTKQQPKSAADRTPYYTGKGQLHLTTFSCTLIKKKNKKTLIVVSLMSAKSTCQMIFCTGQNINLTSCGSECSLVVIFAWTKLFQTAKFDSRHSKGSVCYYRSAEMWSQFWVERKTREQRFKLMWT